MHPAVMLAAEFVGLKISEDGAARLGRFGRWLQEEAIPAGALGPAEADRIEVRHLADSIVMGYEWSRGAPGLVSDLGSGAGLPGLPLAILLPDWQFQLVERSSKRAALLRRALRVLQVFNVEVMEADYQRTVRPSDVVLARAIAPAGALVGALERWTQPQGVAVVAVSAATEPPSGMEAVDIPRGILDRPARLLIMHHR